MEMRPLHKELGVDTKETARIVYEVTRAMGEPATFSERIKHLEKKFKGRALLLAVFQLGWESAIADAYYKGFTEVGIFEPAISGAYVADQFYTGNARYNEILKKGEDAIKEIERAFKMLEEDCKDVGVI